MTQAERVIKALGRGPLHAYSLRELTGLSNGSLSRTVRDLMVKGVILRGFDKERGSYRLNPARSSVTIHRGRIAREAEDAYVGARRAGRPPRDAARELGLSQTAKGKFEEAFRLQTWTPTAQDSSCPKFAKHEDHVAALAVIGAFPVMPSVARSRLPA